MEQFDWERIAHIMAGMAAGGVSEEQKQYLDRWLESSPTNRTVYQRFMRGESLKAYLGDDDTVAGRPKARRRRIAWAASAAAAAIVGVMVILRPVPPETEIVPSNPEPRYEALLSFEDGRQVKLRSHEQGGEWKKYADPVAEAATDESAAPAQMIKITIPRGKEYKLELEDGTLVWLNAGTTMEYPAGFADRSRRVRLDGEAYFEVARDTLRPFGIETGDGLTINVLGTRFNVNGYRDLPQTLVTLVEGSVRVDHASGHVSLAPNEQAVFDRGLGTLSSRPVDNASDYITWIEGVFNFRSAPLGEILESMARWYGVTVAYEDFDITGAGEFTIKANRHDDFTQILDILHYVAGIEYSLQEDTVTIRME